MNELDGFKLTNNHSQNACVNFAASARKTTLWLFAIVFGITSCHAPVIDTVGEQQSTNTARSQSTATKPAVKKKKKKVLAKDIPGKEIVAQRDRLIHLTRIGKHEQAEQEIAEFERRTKLKTYANFLRALCQTNSAIDSGDRNKMCLLGRQLVLRTDVSTLRLAAVLLELGGAPKEAVAARSKRIAKLESGPDEFPFEKKDRAFWSKEFIELALVKAQAGDWKGCTEAFARAVEFNAKKPSFIKRKLWGSRKNEQSANDELKGLKKQNSSSDNQVLFDRARLESALGLELAKVHFSDFCKKDKERAYLGHYHLAEIAYYQGDYLNSAQEMGKVMNIPSGLGKTRKRNHDAEQTFYESHQIVADTENNDPDSLLIKGMAADRTKNLDLAERLYSQAYKSLPKGSQSRVQAAVMLYICMRQRGKIKESEALLKEVSKVAEGTWAEPLVGFFKHQVNENELIASAKGNRTSLTRYYYYLTVIDNCTQNLAAKRRHLTWLRQNGDKGVDEYELAERYFDYPNEANKEG